MTENTSEKRSNKAAVTIAILVIIIMVMGVKIYLDHQEKEEQVEVISNTEQELATTMQRLTDISAELDEKIREIEELGGDVSELQEAKAEIEAELERTQRVNASTIRNLRDRVEGYEELLVEKDKELERLKSMNEVLLSENTELKEEKNVLNTQIEELDKTTGELSEKVQIASELRAEDIEVIAVNRRGKERISPFKNRHIEQLKIVFNIPENKVAPVEGKDVMIRLIDQNGQVFFDVDRGSGTFIIDGKELFYTAQQTILYDKTEQNVVFLYEKGSEWADGRYDVEIYTEDYLMGSGSFEVK